jgi:hypothetical protein
MSEVMEFLRSQGFQDVLEYAREATEACAFDPYALDHMLRVAHNAYDIAMAFISQGIPLCLPSGVNEEDPMTMTNIFDKDEATDSPKSTTTTTAPFMCDGEALRILMLAALMHDVPAFYNQHFSEKAFDSVVEKATSACLEDCGNGGSVYDEKAVEEFCRRELDENYGSVDRSWRAKVVLALMDNISLSAERVYGKPFLGPFDRMRDVLADANRLDAIGTNGMLRVLYSYRRNSPAVITSGILYGNAHADYVAMSLAVEHARTSLLTRLPSGYFHTERGRELAGPLHNELEAFVQECEELCCGYRVDTGINNPLTSNITRPTIVMIEKPMTTTATEKTAPHASEHTGAPQTDEAAACYASTLFPTPVQPPRRFSFPMS